MTHRAPEQLNTLVIGGGQAGLAVGYHLSRAGVPFLIVDASQRTGDAWRNRGVVDVVPGLYFVALKFLYSVLSDTLLAVGRDAGYVVDHLVERRQENKLSEAVS